MVSESRTGVDGLLDDAAPRVLVVRQLLGEVLVHEQVLQRRVALVRLLNLVQEAGADDAAALWSKAAQETFSLCIISSVHHYYCSHTLAERFATAG